MDKCLKILGNIIICIVIFACLPLAVPRIIGFQGFNVISGSMEPEISIGSMVYVKQADFDELSEGDVIAFESGASVVTHRIAAIDQGSQLLTTKGDANDVTDFMPVAYTNVIGKVAFHLPFFGYIAAFLSETYGKIVAAIILIVGVVLSNAEDKKAPEKERDQGAVKASKSPSINPKIILALGLVIIIGSLGGFLYIFMVYQKDKDYYAGIQDEYFKWPYQQYPDGPQGGEFPWYEKIYVDLEGLQQLNPDVIGWLYVEGTEINYPILFSGDDSTYLHTNLNHEQAKAGSIFLEGLNLPDWSDSHNIIYGHNMRNLSMFGSLKFYKTADDYYDDHMYFQIVTSEGRERYEIFSYFDTEAASWVYTVPYYDDEEFEEYISQLKKHSYRNIDTVVKSSDKVVTLSTCSTSGKRFTVHGVLVDKK